VAKTGGFCYFMTRSMVTETDSPEALMRQAQAGDARAYQALLRLSAQLLRPFLGKFLRGANEVDDVIQEILLSLHRARHTYDGMRPFKPWLFAIARFRLKDHLRKVYRDNLRGAADLADFEETIAAPGGEHVTESSDQGEYIKEAVAQLPQKQAMILKLMYEDGLTAAETAKRLGMGLSAVKVAAHRAYKVLRKKLTAAA